MSLQEEIGAKPTGAAQKLGNVSNKAAGAPDKVETRLLEKLLALPLRNLPSKEHDMILTDWLQRKIEVDELEEYFTPSPTVNLLTGERTVSGPSVPDKVKVMVQSMQDGDELWEFSTPDEFWESMCGRKGVALLRGRKIIDATVTFMN